MDASIVREKLDQVPGILDELGIDAWLTFARETTESGDPVLPLILGQPVTWQSAFIVSRGGHRTAIVGRYEDEAVRSTGAWPQVVSYVEGIRPSLLAALETIDPETLAINYSIDDVKADGLSYGLYLLLQEHLRGSPWSERLVSAEEIIRRLRGRKTDGELARLRAAIATTDEIFAAAAARARPGTSELEVARFMHEQVSERGLTTAWETAQCPIVTTGPDSMVGHGLPSADLQVTPGGIFHVDFGVQQDDYCSDIQRAWYVPEPGESAPPPAVAAGFEAVLASIRAAADAMRPGVAGWQVDEAARRTLVAAGYPEYQHATGHHVGRAAHDGAGVLGPRWPRYGRTPEYPLEAGNVLTLELGIENLDGRGYLGLEEMVLVTDDGIEWLSDPQTSLPLLGTA
ncbi:MAG: M24 family metallopeptidase [Planctomycetota bacterium]|jgi:Xaa-Pro aminopeptidase